MPRPFRAANVPRPTRTAALLFTFAILLELLGRLVESTSITIAAAAALGAVIGDAALTPRIDGVTFTRKASPRWTCGVAAPVQLVFSQPDRRRTRLPPLLFIEDYPGETPIRVLTPALRRGSPAGVQIEVIPQHRGYWEAVGEDTLEARSPLGGFVRRRRITTESLSPRWVHPAPAPAVLVPDTALGAPSDAAGASRSGHGLEFFGIREWRSGDAASSVHWRASARRNQLVVMDRERPAKAALVVVVGTAAPGPSWEFAIARAAATAVAARRSGQPVLLLNGQELASPDSRNDVLDWFAELAETPRADAATVGVALRQQGPGTTVLWLSTEAVQPDVARIARAAAAGLVPVCQTPVRG